MLTQASPPTQRQLAELLAERVTRLGGAMVDGRPVADSRVLVLVSSLSPADLAQGTRRFAAVLRPDEADAWRRSWTRTSFLFGNPANLRPDAARLVSPAATAAWLGPFPDHHRPGISRLLKPVSGTLPALPAEVDVAGTGPPRALWIAVDQLSLADYLVHLHHTVAEAVLLGSLRPDEPLRLHHRPTLDAGAGGGGAGGGGAGGGGGDPAYARVLPEPDGTGRLRLHTWLSTA